MLIKDVMTKGVITASSNTPVSDAKRIMKEHGFRRLPVVDDGKLVGVVTEARLERVSPKSTTPLLWQVAYIVSHTTVRDVMETKIITIKPTATVEQGVALAQKHHVGSLIVVDKGKVVGIVTTNDFFYHIVNPILGIGKPGTRILVTGAGDSKSAEKALACLNKFGIELDAIWIMEADPETKKAKKDIVFQVDTEDVTPIIEELNKCGFVATIRPRKI